MLHNLKILEITSPLNIIYLTTTSRNEIFRYNFQLFQKIDYFFCLITHKLTMAQHNGPTSLCSLYYAFVAIFEMIKVNDQNNVIHCYAYFLNVNVVTIWS